LKEAATSTELQLVTDTDTDRHRATATPAVAQRRVGRKMQRKESHTLALQRNNVSNWEHYMCHCPHKMTNSAYIQFTTHTHTYTHTCLMALFLGLPRSAGTRKAKPSWILLKQETVSGSGISWAICKSAHRSRQITTPAPNHSVFTGRMPFLPPNQQHQSTEDKSNK